MDEPRLPLDLVRNRQELLGFIFALTRDFEVAEEVFQDLAVVVLNESTSGTDVRRFMPWAREIARRRVAEYYRKSARRRSVEIPAESFGQVVCQAFEENESSPEERRLRLVYLDQCIKQLPDRSREVIDRRYRDRSGVQVIASAMKWKVKSVSVALSRARKALAECIRLKLRRVEGL